MSQSNFQPIGLGDGVQSEELHEGKPHEDRYFDQSQLRLVDRRVHVPLVLGVVETPEPEVRRSNGGPGREGVGFRR